MATQRKTIKRVILLTRVEVKEGEGANSYDDEKACMVL
jgi:hypothetical protein